MLEGRNGQAKHISVEHWLEIVVGGVIGGRNGQAKHISVEQVGQELREVVLDGRNGQAKHISVEPPNWMSSPGRSWCRRNGQAKCASAIFGW